MKACQCGAPASGPRAKYCDPCRALANTQAQRSYKARNRAAVNETSRARMRALHAADPDTWNLLRRQRRLANPELARQRDREIYTRKVEKKRRAKCEYRRRFPEKVKAAVIAWVAAHPDRVRELSRRASSRRRTRLSALPSPGVTTEQWRSICEVHGFRCAYCGNEDKLTVDHVIPISRGGLDAPDNVVPACKSCNSSKGAKLLHEWRLTRAA